MRINNTPSWLSGLLLLSLTTACDGQAQDRIGARDKADEDAVERLTMNGSIEAMAGAELRYAMTAPGLDFQILSEHGFELGWRELETNVWQTEGVFEFVSVQPLVGGVGQWLDVELGVHRFSFPLQPGQGEDGSVSYRAIELRVYPLEDDTIEMFETW